MTIVRSVFGTLLALVAMLMAVVISGQRLALIDSVVIAAVATVMNAAERRTMTSMKRTAPATQPTVFGALWAVIALWAAIAILGPRDIAGPLFGMIFTVVIIVTAIVLKVSLKRDPFTSVTTSGVTR